MRVGVKVFFSMLRSTPSPPVLVPPAPSCDEREVDRSSGLS
jgi:hypothetical protein